MMSKEAKNAIEYKPVVEDLDSEPTEQDLEKALGSPPPEKAPGQDGIRVEITLYENRGLEATATLSRHLTPQHRCKAILLELL